MNSSLWKQDIYIAGIGVTTAIGQGKEQFCSALLRGAHNFQFMKRDGRQYDILRGEGILKSQFIGAEIETLSMPEYFSPDLLRTASFSSQVALGTLYEAWNEARLAEIDPTKIGLIVGGSNVQQRELLHQHDKYRDRIEFLRPTYALSFMDSDICGLCTEAFGIKGFAYTVGGASASGQLAVIQAINSIQSGQVDVCIALGAMMDLSYFECQAFRALGAMGSDKFAAHPQLACRPFDKDHDGFIYGEACGAVVVANADALKKITLLPYGRIAGWGIHMDGNRNPNPSFEGECSVIQQALARAGMRPKDIDYINPHGTGSIIGDETELKAIHQSGLSHAYINATKSLLGHGLTAAGNVELIATLLQMRSGNLHPTNNLISPIAEGFNWVKDKTVAHQIHRALKMSMGFGGMNTALCIENIR